MSVMSNYKFTQPYKVEFIGDYKQHKGNPALLRSDSMLKAIGKSINIRVKLSFIVKTYLSNFQSRINHIEPISMESTIAFGIGKHTIALLVKLS